MSCKVFTVWYLFSSSLGQAHLLSDTHEENYFNNPHHETHDFHNKLQDPYHDVEFLQDLHHDLQDPQKDQKNPHSERHDIHIKFQDPLQDLQFLKYPVYNPDLFDPAPLIHPVLLVPGDGGSQIEARLNKTKSAHWWCRKTSDWYDLWLNIQQMLTFTVECWKENVKLHYNTTSHTTSNVEGVETRIPGFGNTTNIEYLDKSSRSFSTYFAKIVSYLLPLGYIRGENLIGAPYDFRKAANEHLEYFDNVKALIESTYTQNGETSVVLVCHSMGCIMMSYFLNRQDQDWKDKHIRSLVSVAGVWGGTARAIKVFAVGDNLNSWFLNEKNLLWERTNPSLAWLMPQEGFWGDDEVLVESEERNFTRTDLADFFRAYDEPNMASMVEDTKDLLAGLPPPGVEVFCNHGSKVDTTERLVYPPGSFPVKPTLDDGENKTSYKFWPFPSYAPTLIKGDGDGTVNIRSLEGCLNWVKLQPQPVHHKVFENVNHLEMLRLDEPPKHIADIVDELNKQNKENKKKEMEKKAKENKEISSRRHDISEREYLLHPILPIIEVIE